jgi:Ammonia permease
MTVKTRPGRGLSMSEKCSRLWKRLREPEWRRYGGTLIAGKMLGMGVVLLMIAVISGVFFTHVYAQTGTPEVKASDVVNPVNTAWTLVAAFLVFGMQVGFTMLEAGFCRSRETVNVLVECVVDTCLCGILFYAVGFAFMFSHGNGFIGYHWFFLQNAPATMKLPALHSWQSGFSSSLLLTPARPLLRAR